MLSDVHVCVGWPLTMIKVNAWKCLILPSYATITSKCTRPRRLQTLAGWLVMRLGRNCLDLPQLKMRIIRLWGWIWDVPAAHLIIILNRTAFHPLCIKTHSSPSVKLLYFTNLTLQHGLQQIVQQRKDTITRSHKQAFWRAKYFVWVCHKPHNSMVYVTSQHDQHAMHQLKCIPMKSANV